MYGIDILSENFLFQHILHRTLSCQSENKKKLHFNPCTFCSETSNVRFFFFAIHQMDLKFTFYNSYVFLSLPITLLLELPFVCWSFSSFFRFFSQQFTFSKIVNCNMITAVFPQKTENISFMFFVQFRNFAVSSNGVFLWFSYRCKIQVNSLSNASFVLYQIKIYILTKAAI